MRKIPRGAKVLAVLAGTALIAAACGDDGGSSADTTAAEATETTEAAAETTAATETTAAEGAETTAADGGGAAGGMTVSFKIADEAVWDDGSPITVADLQCTLDAVMNTPGSLSTSGYDKITSVDQGDTEKDVVINFSEPYAAYKILFGYANGIIKADSVADCKDVSADFGDNIPFSGREWKIESWSPDQLILVPNEAYWNADKTPKAKRVVMVPKADSDTEINSLKSGESDFIFPQAYAGISDALADPNIEFEPGYGANFEGLYFQQLDGPFADDAFREGFSKSVDRDLILANIYDPIFPGSPLLNCGFWVPTIGEWCDNTQFEGSYDPEGAKAALEAGGWTLNGDGLWEKDGTVPEIRWMINEGNKRREDTQALMIPVLREAGFNVVTDNADAATVFQKRLPALDYDLGMYITTASPDPTPTGIFACDQIPSPENDNQGQNSSGWCNEEASKVMVASDQELDETARVELIHEVGQYFVDDHVLLPLFQFPNIAAYRTDKLGGPVTADAANTRAFGNNMYAWEPLSGDQIVIGAEQWPECLNPVTECANSSWYVWTTAFNVMPGIFDTTAEGTFVTTDLVDGEVTVTEG